MRDAGALTSSITGGSIGLPEDVYSLDAPLDDVTVGQGWTQEARLSGGNESLQWVGGAFYAYTQKHYAQSLIVDGFTEPEPASRARDFAPTKTSCSTRT